MFEVFVRNVLCKKLIFFDTIVEQRIMVEMDSLPPFSAESPNAEQERAFAKEALELAVLLSVNVGDKESFQKYVSCLRPYYTSLSDK